MKHGLSIKAIEEIITAGLPDNDTTKALEIFLAAGNDWSSNPSSLEEYVTQIEEVLQGKATKQYLEQFARDADFSRHAWNAESASQLLEVYQFYGEHLSLSEIISDLKNKLGIK